MFVCRYGLQRSINATVQIFLIPFSLLAPGCLAAYPRPRVSLPFGTRLQTMKGEGSAACLPRILNS
jgi:hypothetical protein